jgi:hypothetical protein
LYFCSRKRNQKRKEQNYENRKSNNPRSDGPGAGNACHGPAFAQRWPRRWQPWWLVYERTEPQQRPLAQQFELQLTEPQLEHSLAQLQQLVGNQEHAESQLQCPEPQQPKCLEPQLQQPEFFEPQHKPPVTQWWRSWQRSIGRPSVARRGCTYPQRHGPSGPDGGWRKARRHDSPVEKGCDAYASGLA